jgi:hypothetical protein
MRAAGFSVWMPGVLRRYGDHVAQIIRLFYLCFMEKLLNYGFYIDQQNSLR